MFKEMTLSGAYESILRWHLNKKLTTMLIIIVRPYWLVSFVFLFLFLVFVLQIRLMMI